MNKRPVLNARTIALRVLVRVAVQGQSLTQALTSLHDQQEQTRINLVKELCYGTLRWYYQLDAIVGKLLNKPLKKKDQDVRLLMLMGVYQLRFLEIGEHAVVTETVNVAREINKDWAVGLVNAILRGYQRQSKTIIADLKDDEVALYAHPRWLVDAIRTAWPGQWQQVLEQNNQRPPMSLRVNCRHNSREDYLQRLSSQDIEANGIPHTRNGIVLARPMPVESLPGFHEGDISVQDGAAQLAAELLKAEQGQVVLDACAAPGGKTCHILECQPGLKSLLALDVEQERLKQVSENLDRLGLNRSGMVSVRQGDAADNGTPWWNGELFDRILLDAPCSATGVIRRHPDIKLLRQPGDIETLVALQAGILRLMWRLLKPGGLLVYATCSVLPSENHQQVTAFLTQHTDAKEDLIEAQWGQKQAAGRQVLPGDEGMDGFYYARLEKLPTGR